MQAPTVHFPQSLRLRVPQGLPEALQTAAKQRHTTPSEWARQALLRGLEAQGVRLSTLEAATEHQTESKGQRGSA
jgi:predicted transcriptional regulator